MNNGKKNSRVCQLQTINIRDRLQQCTEMNLDLIQRLFDNNIYYLIFIQLLLLFVIVEWIYVFSLFMSTYVFHNHFYVVPCLPPFFNVNCFLPSLLPHEFTFYVDFQIFFNRIFKNHWDFLNDLMNKVIRALVIRGLIFG